MAAWSFPVWAQIMCGIAGIARSRFNPEQSVEVLGRMCRALHHRGPDEEGLFFYPETASGIACSRLSIVDLATGHQPIACEDGSVLVVCNGEIYNHRQLRARLENRGHSFRTTSDVEVIAHLYEEEGEECLDRLDGMFGLAVLDLRRRRLLLARDRCGMKPLYYADTPSGFLFASEPGALLASGMISAKPDWGALDTHLAAGFLPAPRTCFLGISKLPAGDRLVVDASGVRRQTWWRLRYRAPERARSDEDYARELETLIESAVKSHLAADVPVGAYVSGGWDSSLVAWFAERMSPSQLKTFSVTFPDVPARDEGRFARIVAQDIGSDHHEIEFRPEDLPPLLPALARHLGEPCHSTASLALYRLASLAASSVKTVVGGEGADELFAGYTWVQAGTEVHYRLRRLVPRRLARAVAGYVTEPRWRRLWRVLACEAESAADSEWHRVFDASERDRFLWADPAADKPDLLPLRLDQETAMTCRSRFERRLALDFTHRLPERTLLVDDRMSMANSVEVRMPFLDRAIVDFASGLPSRMKRRGRQEKYILSFLVQRLPERIACRRKRGLVTPVDQYFRGPLRGFVREFLLDGNGRGFGPFDRDKLEPLLDRWLAGRDTFPGRLWALVILQAWWNEYIGR